MDVPPGSKLRHPELLGYNLQATLAVPPSGSCTKFPPPPYGKCLTSPSQSTLDVTLSEGWPNIPWQRGRSWNCRKTKGDNKVDNKLEGLVGLGVFLVHPLIMECDRILKWFGKSSLVGPYQSSGWLLLSIYQFRFLCAADHHKLQRIFAPLVRIIDLSILNWAPIKF